MDSNLRPSHWECDALTDWAIPAKERRVGTAPTTSVMVSPRSTNWAISAYNNNILYMQKCSSFRAVNPCGYLKGGMPKTSFAPNKQDSWKFQIPRPVLPTFHSAILPLGGDGKTHLAFRSNIELHLFHLPSSLLLREMLLGPDEPISQNWNVVRNLLPIWSCEECPMMETRTCLTIL